MNTLDHQIDKVLAARTAREMLALKDAIIWDTKTTGLRNPRIVTIAAIDLKGKTLLDTLINPEIHIESGASQVHGIFDADVQGALPFRYQLIDIWAVLCRGPWIVYNLGYDRPILASQMAQVPLGNKTYTDAYNQRKDHRYSDYCAMETYAQFAGEWNDYHGNYRWQKLTTACDQLGIAEIEAPAHSRLVDCRRTLAVLQAMDAWLTKHEKTS